MNIEQIKKVVSQMTLEQKAEYCIGKDFWHTQELPQAKMPSMWLTDGPHGLRKQDEGGDMLGISASKPAICFPTGSALASSFDKKVAEQMGSELGKLSSSEHVAVTLGPAMNIKRSPLCGRNFEYFSEDPFVSSQIGAAVVNGMQGEGIGACPKHFLANNQENRRMTSDSIMDERTLREIYLASFEDMVKTAKPLTMMCSYNRINGTYACENKKMLTDILRDEWGFDGIVMTDWGALNDPVESLKAGLNLGMPGPGKSNVDALVEAVKQGSLEEEILDKRVEELIRVFSVIHENKKQDDYDFEKGHQIARTLAGECMVLLKNEQEVLPLSKDKKITFIGEFAEKPRYQGGGSSHINSYRVSSILDIITNSSDYSSVDYCKGYDIKTETLDLEKAITIAENSDVVVIFAGLPDDYETEGYDRDHMDLPKYMNVLISAVSAAQPNTVVVLFNGSPVAMPWASQVNGILEAYLGGEAVSEAVLDVLFGDVNPSGRLAETFPVALADTPAYPYYGVEKAEVNYREGILVGYRHYLTKKQAVLFPFGHGLSYTSFVYSNLKVDKTSMRDQETLSVSVDVTNQGNRSGKEVVQLYVAGCQAKEIRPLRELKGFEKIQLHPGETKTVSFELRNRAFAYWNVELNDWFAPSGDYTIEIGKSSVEIVLTSTVKIESTSVLRPHFHLNSAMGDLLAHPIAAGIMQQVIGQMGRGQQTSESEIESIGVMNQKSMQSTMDGMPLRSLLSFSDQVTKEGLQQLLDGINLAISQA